MQLRYNFRVYPTPSQRTALAKAFGCARVVFNDGLRARQTAREQGLPYVSDGELSKQVITRDRRISSEDRNPRPSGRGGRQATWSARAVASRRPAAS